MRFVRLFLLLLPLSGMAQNLLRFPSEILSTKKSFDQSRIALTTVDSVYIVDATNFSIIKQWKHNEPLPIVVDFHPYNNNVLLLQRNNINASSIPALSDAERLKFYFRYQKTWTETPTDSITLWDINKAEKLRTATGSFYIQFGRKDGEYAGIMNQVYTYQYQGATNYSARAAELFTSDGDSSKTTRIPKAGRRLLMDHRKKNLAISWYDGYINGRSVYSFSIMRFRDHAQLFRIDSLPEIVGDFCFDLTGDKIAISASFQKENDPSIRLYEVATGKLLQELKGAGEQLSFSDDNKLLQYRTDDGNWIQWDIAHNKNVQKVWAGLTSLWSLDNIVSIGDQLLISGVSWAGIPMNSDKIFRLESVRLSDVKLFSTINDPVTGPLTDSNAFTMQLNDISEDARLGRADIRFNNDRTLFTSTQENQLQIWNTALRKKILQRNFPRSIKAFPDRTGNNIMVVEDNGQQSYSEYRMHLLSLRENTNYTSGPILDSDTTLNGSFNRCNCLPDPIINNTWTCTDGGGTIWRVSGQQLSQKAVVRIPDFRITTMDQTTDGIVWVMGFNKNEDRLIAQVDLVKGTSTIVKKTDTDRFYPDGNGFWTWNSQDDSTLSYWENGSLRSSLKLSGRVIRVEKYFNRDALFVQLEKGSYQFWQLIKDRKDSLPIHRTEWINARFYPLKDNTILTEARNLHTIINEGAYTINWTITSPYILRNTNFDVSPSGRFVLIQNHVVDLKEIAQWNINKYNPAQLLQDTGSLKWVEIISDVDYSGQKAGFSIIRLEKNGRDTVFGKKWFRAEKVDPFAFNHEQLAISENKRWLITSPEIGKGKNSPPVLWDMQTMDGRALGSGKENTMAYFADDDRSIIVSSYKLSPDGLTKNELIEYYTLEPLKKIKEIKRVAALNVLIPESRDRYSINNRNVEWFEFAHDSLRLKRRYFSRDYLEFASFHEPSGLIVAGTYSGSIHFWERNGSSSPATTLNAHHAAIVRMETRGDRLYTLGADGSITITHIPDKKILVRIITLQRAQGISMAIYTPEGFYKADPALATSLHFVKNGSIYPLSSFEYQGNRPDKVYGNIGLADQGFIELLKQSWEARLKRAGIKAAEKPAVPIFPFIDWNRKNSAALVTDSVFTIDLKVVDAQAGKSTLFIRDNGVPVGSKNGIIVNSAPDPIAQRFSFHLNEGKNHISVIAVNARGEESIEQEFDVYYQPAQKKIRRVFYAGIGVSKYKDSAYNLRYAAKDVNDISEKLEPYFDSVYSFTLTNENASKQNINKLHEWLKKTGADDIVILSLSGHGMIAEGKGFFFAPHEMNFNDPAQSGISMSDLENLLDDIPARKRLLLLDACHSGEEWSDTTQRNSLPEGVSITRGGKIKSASGNSTAPKRQSFLLMKELFSDLSRGNGAFMISAAGSTEFAYEGKEWKNGVFTRSFLEALHELRYRDSFKGAQTIPVSELRKLIYDKVSTLTKGMQNPTSRQENGWWDWEL